MTEIIGKTCSVVGHDTEGGDGRVAHICLDFVDGRRLFIESPSGPLLFKFEPGASNWFKGACQHCAHGKSAHVGEALKCPVGDSHWLAKE